MDWPKSRAEFEELILAVDKDLRRGQVPIPWRPLEALRILSSSLHAEFLMDDSADSPGRDSFEGQDFAGHVLEWFRARYGPRLLLDFGPGQVLLVIRGDPWTASMPKIFGRVHLCLSPDSGPADPAQRGKLPSYNVLDSVRGLPSAMREDLSPEELRYIWTAVTRGLRVLTSLAALSHLGLVAAARRDLDALVCHCMAQPPHFGQARWSALQAAEKVIKAFMSERGKTFPRTHDLGVLWTHASAVGLPLVDAKILALIQCPAAVRYSDQGTTIASVGAAQDAALEVCGIVTGALLPGGTALAYSQPSC